MLVWKRLIHLEGEYREYEKVPECSDLRSAATTLGHVLWGSVCETFTRTNQTEKLACYLRTRGHISPPAARPRAFYVAIWIRTNAAIKFQPCALMVSKIAVNFQVNHLPWQRSICVWASSWFAWNGCRWTVISQDLRKFWGKIYCYILHFRIDTVAKQGGQGFPSERERAPISHREIPFWDVPPRPPPRPPLESLSTALASSNFR